MLLAALAAGAAFAQVTTNCTPATLPPVAGGAVNVTCAPAGGVAPYTWSITTGALPASLSQDPNTGSITGTVPASPYSFTVTATDSTSATGSQLYTDPLNFGCSLASGPVEVGVLYTNACTVSGGIPPYTWSLSGQIVPAGLIISPTGTISYTPLNPLVSYQYSVIATDKSGTPFKKGLAFTGSIQPAVTITTTSPLPPAFAGSNYSQQFAASGGIAPYAWSATGLTGTGLSLSPTGLLSGIPASVGTLNFSVTATDSVGGTTGPIPFSLTVAAGLTITTTSPLPPATVNTLYSQTFAATGGSGTGYTWSVTGQPAWLSMSAAGVLSGTPPSTAVTTTFTVKVTDSASNTASGSFTLPVNLSITTTSPLPLATIGTLYSQTFAAVGGTGGYSWAATGLPSWLSMSTAGVLSGNPPSNATTASFTVTVTDSSNASVSGPFTVPVSLTITTASPLPNGSISVAYSASLAGAGGTPPYTWSLATGSSLPGGLSLSPAGAITGTPTTPGTFNFTVQLKDSATPTANVVTKPFSITITGTGLSITSPAALPNATVGVAYSETLQATGGATPYTWAVTTGSLPAPLALNSSTGAITGTPTATSTSTFTVTVTDNGGTTAQQTFTLTVVTPPVITTTSLPNGAPGTAYSQTLAASGGTSPYTWTISSGALPGGLSLSAAGTISGTPATPGISNFTVQVKDSTGVTATKALTLTIVSTLAVTTTSPLPSGEVGIPYSQTLAATGGASPYAWTVTAGALPQGLTLTSSGVISGTPNLDGQFSFTVQVTDSNRVTAKAALALTIAAAVTISTPAALLGGSVNSSYSVSLTATAGIAPYTWTVTSGTLPAGLGLSSAGAITGVPTTAGTSTFTVKVTDALSATATRQFTIVIAAGLTITTPATLPTATVGVPYSEMLQAIGGAAPYTWIVTTGSLPTGLALSSGGSITGLPTATVTASFTVQVTDSVGVHAQEQMSLTVAPALSITTSTLPGGAVGGAYSQTLAATGGTPPYSWSIVSGALPGGLSLSKEGVISGTPSATGAFSFTIEVTDSASATATKKLSITVATGLTITTAGTLPNAAPNASYSQTLSAAGGTAPYTWALTAGALPAGLTLSPTGVIAGTPTASGSFNFTATVTDSLSAKATQQFSLVVGSGLTFTTTSLPGGKSGTPYSQTLAVTGGTSPYTFAKTAGTLPPGIALSGDTLSGTPTTNGTYTFTIQVTDSASATAIQQFTIVISGLAITTAGTLPVAALGTPYSETLVAAGTSPYTWAVTQGALPGGLSLDPSTGIISGTPAAAGNFSFTVQVTDVTSATATQAFTLTVISASFTGISGTTVSGQQVSGTLALGAAYPAGVTGTITLTFQPDASLAAAADDPAIQFSSGGRTLNFTIAANSTAAIPFALQSGSVAGSITLTVAWQSSGAALAVPAALSQTIRIAPGVPAITAVSASSTSSGLQVLVTGYSNTREVSQALVQFTPAAGQTLQQTSFTISLTAAANTWFQSSTSDQYGGTFVLTLPFSVSNGAASAIGSVSVQLVNSQGTSPSASATF
jgi:hypothetical protein